MSKPLLLDLFCGAGGVSVGYDRAGFEVVGVDINPQPNYPFAFYQADALTFPLIGFDVIHASPPCQAYCGSTAWRGSRDKWPRLIGPIRERLAEARVPYIIENVPDARHELIEPTMLCGSMFGLQIRRHRYFETNWCLWRPTLGCSHAGLLAFDHGGTAKESTYRAAMDCEWMTVRESREAIPPAYTEWIGNQLFAEAM